MGMISEFKEFIARGNVVDLAVGVVIGAAFGKIVTALVDGIVMPVIGMVTGGVSVADWKHVITPAQIWTRPASRSRRRSRSSTARSSRRIIDFLLIAFVIFLLLKAYNRMRAGRRCAGRDAGRRAAAARDPRLAEER